MANKVEPLADRVRAVYDRLWIDCAEITQEDAEILLEAIKYIRGSAAFDRSLSESFNSGNGTYHP